MVIQTLSEDDAQRLAEDSSRDESRVSRAFARRQFEDRPLLVFWEMTKACGLACLHCRACAQLEPGDDELSEAEGRALIDELAAMGRPRPILILTGGDCLKRADLIDLIGYAVERSVPVAVAPSVTELLDDAMMHSLRQRGVKTVSLSLDGADAATHDGVRGVPGHFDATMQAISSLKHCGFTVQINTTVMASNREQLADVAALVRDMGVDIWEVFFLIVTGRGVTDMATTAEENEDVGNFLVDASRYGFIVRTVEAPFFRRIAAERRSGRGDTRSASGTSLYARLHARLVDLLGEPILPARTPSAATRDGKGIIFVATNGDVYPSGFLPVRLGNVRQQRLSEIYRDNVLLRKIRNADFNGVCGSCEYAQICGGSRSRAYAASGDPLGSDPGCILVQSATSSDSVTGGSTTSVAHTRELR